MQIVLRNKQKPRHVILSYVCWSVPQSIKYDAFFVCGNCDHIKDMWCVIVFVTNQFHADCKENHFCLQLGGVSFLTSFNFILQYKIIHNHGTIILTSERDELS